jgi:hypothetical protein
MATVLEVCNTEEQLSLVRFYEVGRGTEVLNAKNSHKKSPVYSRKRLSRKAVHNWVEKFSQVRSKFADD